MKVGGKEWSSFSRPNPWSTRKPLFATVAVKSITWVRERSPQCCKRTLQVTRTLQGTLWSLQPHAEGGAALLAVRRFGIYSIFYLLCVKDELFSKVDHFLKDHLKESHFCASDVLSVTLSHSFLKTMGTFCLFNWKSACFYWVFKKRVLKEEQERIKRVTFWCKGWCTNRVTRPGPKYYAWQAKILVKVKLNGYYSELEGLCF